MNPVNTDKTSEEKARWELHKNATSYFELILEVTPPQNNSCTATYLLSQKPTKRDEQDMWDTIREARISS